MASDQSKEELIAQRMKRMPQGFGIEWTSLRSFNLGSTEFKVVTALGEHNVLKQAEEEGAPFYFCKGPGMIQHYFNLLKERKIQNLVELGVLRGGSVAFLQLLAKPKKFLALELDTERVPMLDQFIKGNGLEGSLRVEHGVNQADSVRIKELVLEHFGEDRCIDHVIDDASHFLTETRSSFETLFPLIRPGGSYIVEDYAAAHMFFSSDFEASNSNDEAYLDTIQKYSKHCLQADQKPVHLLAVEAMLASINAPEIVKKVIVDRPWLRIVRGPKEIEPGTTFDLRALAADKFGLLDSEPHESIRQYLTGL